MWLGELHFQKERSVLASPLVVAGASPAARSASRSASRRCCRSAIRCAWPRTSPRSTTSRGRLDFGGAERAAGHYQGFNIPYEESRDRFFETLEILRKAWTQDRFSHDGRYYQFRDVCVIPKPYQKPHPRSASPPPPRRRTRSWVASATASSRCGRTRSPTKRFVGATTRRGARRGIRAGEVALLVPVYVAESARQAREEPEASTMHWFRVIAEALSRSSTQHGRTQAERLAAVSYDEILGSRSSTGRRTPLWSASGCCARSWASSLSAWMNVGADPPRPRARLDAPLRGARAPAARLSVQS